MLYCNNCKKRVEIFGVSGMTPNADKFTGKRIFKICQHNSNRMIWN